MQRVIKKTLYMETTKIPVGKTVAQIQNILGEYGACAVMSEYENGEVKAICFKVLFLDRELPFRLPCKHEPIFNRLMSKVKKARENTEIELLDQSKRVAWRQILKWVEAQMALIDTEMVKVQEVFLPYIQVGIDGETFYQKLENKGFKALPYSGKDQVHAQHE